MFNIQNYCKEWEYQLLICFINHWHQLFTHVHRPDFGSRAAGGAELAQLTYGSNRDNLNPSLAAAAMPCPPLCQWHCAQLLSARCSDCQLGSGQRYQILSHVFARCMSQKTHWHARIARETRAMLACPCVFWLSNACNSRMSVCFLTCST